MTAPSARPDPASNVMRGSGITFILLGFVSAGLSRLIDGGFVHGMFQGAALSLFLVGSFLVGRSIWGRKGLGEPTDQWLPRRDGPDLPSESGQHGRGHG